LLAHEHVHQDHVMTELKAEPSFNLTRSVVLYHSLFVMKVEISLQSARDTPKQHDNAC
jgi:hypothetical protein